MLRMQKVIVLCVHKVHRKTRLRLDMMYQFKIEASIIAVKADAGYANKENQRVFFSVRGLDSYVAFDQGSRQQSVGR